MSGTRMALAAGCALALFAVACSKPAPPADEAAAGPAAGNAPAASEAKTDEGLPHPCTLLTQQDAVELYGEGAIIERDSVSACMINSPKPAGGGVEVKVEELDPTTWDGGETMKAFDKTVESLPSLAEGGYTYMNACVVFRKGKASVSVIATAYTGPKPKIEVAKLIAERVASRM